MTSKGSYPNIFSAAGLKVDIRPFSSMVMIPSAVKLTMAFSDSSLRRALNSVLVMRRSMTDATSANAMTATEPVAMTAAMTGASSATPPPAGAAVGRK